MEKSREDFEYTYSAQQQEEIEKIRSKYLPKADDKLAQLRKLDESVTKKGTIVGIMIGIVGCLLFGGGLSVILVIGEEMLMAGILLGIPGIVAMAAAYPLFKVITEREKECIAPQILALTEELGI